jgi:hypothetical protein
MKKFIIDRFEGNYAICETEDKSYVQVPKYRLPLECYEGECLILDADEMYRKDIETKTVKEKRIRDKMNRLFENK